MAIRTPEPRIPLEPEEYPLYKPPKRVGCSGLTVVALLALAAFAFLIWRVTPPMAKAITDFPRSLPIIGSGSTSVPDEVSTPVTGGFPTQTALAAATGGPPAGGAVVAPTSTAPPPTPAPTSTPAIEYVKVDGTGGQGVRVLKVPSVDSARVGAVAEGEVLKITGPNTADPKTPNLVWRHVQTRDGKLDGYVSAKYLIASAAPTP